MDLRLVRGPKTKDGVFGTIYDTNDNVIAVTLEYAYPLYPGSGYTAKVAPGAYKCVRYDSPDHGYQVFTLQDVPPFMGNKVTFIEIHIGNYNADSDGCILLGSERNGDMILNSKDTFKKFMDLMKNVDSFILAVTEEL